MPDLSSLSDQNILSVLALINGDEILAAQSAEGRASDAQVKHFARDMVTEHRALQQNVDSLALAKHLTPQSPAVADDMQNRMKAARDSMASLTGAEFDRAYMQAQIRAHEQAADILERLAAAADGTELRDAIRNAVSRVREHLERARSIGSSLGATRG